MAICNQKGVCGVSGTTLIRFAALLAAAAALGPGCPGPRNQPQWRDTFTVDKTNLGPTGTNSYFIPLAPGHHLNYQGHAGTTLTVTTLDETMLVDGVETRVVEEREAQNGALTEVSRNYVAIDVTTNDLYYFGEDVDTYMNGQVIGHEGAWLSGVNGARFGLLLPGSPVVGDRFYHEVAPGIALDRAEIISITEQVQTPAGTFTNCLHIEETSALEPDVGQKRYAPGVGLIQDDTFLLTSIENP
jgi:hypothetical protein